MAKPRAFSKDLKMSMNLLHLKIPILYNPKMTKEITNIYLLSIYMVTSGRGNVSFSFFHHCSTNFSYGFSAH